MSGTTSRRARRLVFGRDPATFDRARLQYPDRVYEILTVRCGLRPGTAVFEIGAGTGIVTRKLLDLGAGSLTVLEPDRRLVRYLLRTLGPSRSRVSIVSRPFEEASLTPGSFDLGVAASSFHWLPERRALRRVARALKAGGWWADWNTHHGDPFRRNPFRHALQPIYRKLYGGRSVSRFSRKDFATWSRRRTSALGALGSFDHLSNENIHWTVTLETARVRDLWSTFSDVIVLPPRKRRWFLSELSRVVDEQFGGKVRIPLLTPVHTARRV